MLLYPEQVNATSPQPFALAQKITQNVKIMKDKILFLSISFALFAVMLRAQATSQPITMHIHGQIDPNQYALGLQSVKVSAINHTDSIYRISYPAEWAFYINIPSLQKKTYITNGQMGAGTHHSGRRLDGHDTTTQLIHFNVFQLVGILYKIDTTILATGLQNITVKVGIAEWKNWKSFYTSEFTVNIQPLSQEDLAAFYFIQSRDIDPFEYPEEGYLLTKRDDATNLALIQEHPHSTFAVLAKLALARQKAYDAKWSPDPVLKQQILQWLEQPLNSPFSHIRYLAEETKSKIKT